MMPPDANGDWTVYEDWLRERLGDDAGPIIAQMRPPPFPEGTQMLEWERLTGPESWSSIWRAAVPGGWLVLASHVEGTGITFMPDPAHRWTITSLPTTRG